MRALFDMPPARILLMLLLATALNLLAATQLRGWPLALAVAGLSCVKAELVILGFMRLHRHSPRASLALVVYACIIALLAGLRIIWTG